MAEMTLLFLKLNVIKQSTAHILEMFAKIPRMFGIQRDFAVEAHADDITLPPALPVPRE